MKTPFLSVCLLMMMLPAFSYSQERTVTVLSEGWKFSKGHHELAYQAEFDDSDWQTVRIPHDWAGTSAIPLHWD